MKRRSLVFAALGGLAVISVGSMMAQERGLGAGPLVRERYVIPGEGASLVNLRTGPGRTYPAITQLSPGTRVMLQGAAKDASGDEWRRVQTRKGDSGFVKGVLLGSAYDWKKYQRDRAGTRTEASPSPSDTQAAAAGAPAPFVIRSPKWVKQPRVSDLRRLRPVGTDELRGVAELICTIGADGWVKQCQLAAERPAGYGFGVAGKTLGGMLKMNPTLPDGRSVEGASVRVRFTFEPTA
ncbi:SH3 domain-containing protein [Caulobacter sp. SLTY]|uniref:SH3 domain-containing protein n=1 Tax=Caulobacter sp. SLTY TaxID=2683262 RepID=UPI00141240E5|nr:SH3 domain-containing protein [Caulobacter sp. SLTY]